MKTAHSTQLEAVYAKITLRLVPFLFLCYLAAYLDRVNVGFAQLQLQQDLGFDSLVYGLGAGMFFVGYVLFEVPSNLLMTRIGARRTLTRIMILWGITSASMMFVSSATSFYVLRFLLGVFEAGFAPGVIFYFTCWYPPQQRAKIMALFLTAVAVSGLIGGPISGAILSAMSGSAGMKGWQWMFLLEGLPSVLLGLMVFFVLSDSPAEAPWLTREEKDMVMAELSADSERQANHHAHFGAALKDWRLYALSFIYFTITAGVYLISFWLPSILKGLGVAEYWKIGLLTAIPNGAAVITMIVVSRRSDKTGERRWHCAVCGLFGAAALLGTFWVQSVAASITLFAVATAGIFTMMPVFWAIPPRFLAGTAAAGGIAVINSIGTMSGFVSPYIVGSLHKMTGSLNAGVLVMLILLLAGIVVLLACVPKSKVEQAPNAPSGIPAGTETK